ncbi:MAG: hypothetical protein BJ554DRAFT_3302 [Olpidium bornovanus]|uniref:Uncharacterized protein n=1 Tax=Olpidium bornovanus TaxID=278681 RepID=A0A8H7ZPH4_9FUNG|nr:MAG: hypothetical protein BJ554DRAFT_3302 [Olpidium bornovanus]
MSGAQNIEDDGEGAHRVELEREPKTFWNYPKYTTCWWQTKGTSLGCISEQGSPQRHT